MNKTVQDSCDDDSIELATFGAGCFWCVEAIFQQVRGVRRVVSGFTGGQRANPTYESVCLGTTGHAEAVQIEFDPAVASYEQLLEIFFQTHDPTTLNRQGADVGTQYRSAIFYHDENQRQKAEEIKKRLDASGAFRSPIATEIAPAEAFYPAEQRHQNYYNIHQGQPYCAAVIEPKLDKFHKVFADFAKN
jgi:peptide-methionine (S)-S-oxide reductase